MKFTAAGDVIIQRRMRADFAGVSEIKPFLEKGDVRFFNLETTLNREGSCPGSQFSGGTYIRTDKECLDDVLAFGFNITTFNNNHAMDFSYEGLSATLDAVNESGIPHTGVGDSLEKASAPAYIDTKDGRAALISVNTTFEPCMKAGNGNDIYPPRRGVNGITVTKKYVVSKDDIEFINALADKTNANAKSKIYRREGYELPLPENEAEFSELRFEAGDTCGIKYGIDEKDLARLENSIKEAKQNADCVVVSVHSHEIDGDSKENVPEFLKELAHRAVEFGASAVIGHGPHLLRPIEVYRGAPIFYSLGDFILELYSVKSAPADFYEKYGMSSDAGIYELLKKRSANFTKGLMEQRVMFQAVVPFWEIKDGKLAALELLPIELIKGTDDEGLPRIAKDPGFVKKLADMSKPYGVFMEINERGTVTCKW